MRILSLVIVTLLLCVSAAGAASRKAANCANGQCNMPLPSVPTAGNTANVRIVLLQRQPVRRIFHALTHPLQSLRARGGKCCGK